MRQNPPAYHWASTGSESSSKAEKLYVWWTQTQHAANGPHLCPLVSFGVPDVGEQLTASFKLRLWDSSVSLSGVSCGSTFHQAPCPRDTSWLTSNQPPLQVPAFLSHCSPRPPYSIQTTLNSLRVGTLVWPAYLSSAYNIYNLHHYDMIVPQCSRIKSIP